MFIASKQGAKKNLCKEPIKKIKIDNLGTISHVSYVVNN